VTFATTGSAGMDHVGTYSFSTHPSEMSDEERGAMAEFIYDDLLAKLPPESTTE
jgi:hypothetical protein